MNMELSSAKKELQTLPDDNDTADNLREEIRTLRELLASLVFERDHLKNVELRDIESAYLRELGMLEAQAYQAECDMLILKARLEMMQASLNREEAIREEKINENIRTQYAEYRKNYDDYAHRVFEANEYGRKREKQKANAAGGSGIAPGGQPEDNLIEEKRETEEQELKRLYRTIVKKMHPDLHPDQDGATKDLFKRAIQAYKDFDLKTLREIAAMLDGESFDETDNALEALLKEKTRLLEMIQGVRAEIEAIKNRYPYTLKAILDDPERLALEKEKLRARIDNAKKAADIYHQRIDEITKKYGRSDNTTE